MSKTLEETPTWVVVVVCFVLLIVSIVIEHIIHGIVKVIKLDKVYVLLQSLSIHHSFFAFYIN